MEINQSEIAVLKETILEALDTQQLTDLQLTLVGGGIGDVTVA
jgi:hypothetical protein